MGRTGKKDNKDHTNQQQPFFMLLPLSFFSAFISFHPQRSQHDVLKSERFLFGGGVARGQRESDLFFAKGKNQTDGPRPVGWSGVPCFFCCVSGPARALRQRTNGEGAQGEKKPKMAHGVKRWKSPAKGQFGVGEHASHWMAAPDGRERGARDETAHDIAKKKKTKQGTATHWKNRPAAHSAAIDIALTPPPLSPRRHRSGHTRKSCRQ